MASPRKTGLWAVVFTALFLFSLDYWWWGLQARPGPLGLPWWVYYFGGLQIALSLALFFFIQFYWRQRDHAGAGR